MSADNVLTMNAEDIGKSVYEIFLIEAKARYFDLLLQKRINIIYSPWIKEGQVYISRINGGLTISLNAEKETNPLLILQAIKELSE